MHVAAALLLASLQSSDHTRPRDGAMSYSPPPPPPSSLVQPSSDLAETHPVRLSFLCESALSFFDPATAIGAKRRAKQELAVAQALDLYAYHVRTLRIAEAGLMTPLDLAATVVELEVAIPADIAPGAQAALDFVSLRAHVVRARLEMDVGVQLSWNGMQVTRFWPPPPPPLPLPAQPPGHEQSNGANGTHNARGKREKAAEPSGSKQTNERAETLRHVVRASGYLCGALALVLCCAWSALFRPGARMHVPRIEGVETGSDDGQAGSSCSSREPHATRD